MIKEKSKKTCVGTMMIKEKTIFKLWDSSASIILFQVAVPNFKIALRCPPSLFQSSNFFLPVLVGRINLAVLAEFSFVATGERESSSFFIKPFSK